MQPNTDPQFDTFISEKIEVEVKEGDTVDTAKIKTLVTKETTDFDGTIGGLKNQISYIEEEKGFLLNQIAIKDALIKELQDKITKYLVEVEAKIASKTP